MAAERQRSCLGVTCWWKDKVRRRNPGYHSHHRALRGKIHVEVAQIGRFSPAGTPLHVASTNTPHPEVTSSAGLYLTQAREKGTQPNTPTCPHARSRGLGLDTDHSKSRRRRQAAPSTSSTEHVITFTGSLPLHPHGAMIALGAAFLRHSPSRPLAHPPSVVHAHTLLGEKSS